MKKFMLGVLAVGCVALIGASCSWGDQAMTKTEAEEKLAAADCFYDPSEDGVEVVFEDPNWVIKKNNCLGECRINAETGETQLDVNPMCMGLLPEGSEGGEGGDLGATQN